MNMKKLTKKTIWKKIKWHIKEIGKLLIAMLTLSACGVTKASVSKPAEGTQTTITITTSNPITTDVSPNVELKTKGN